MSLAAYLTGVKVLPGRVLCLDVVVTDGGRATELKIRKQGNILAVTIDPHTLTAANLREGDLVVPSVQRGLIVLTPVEVRPKVRSRVLEVAARSSGRIAEPSTGSRRADPAR
jgi:antitoxin component of MazEF toxin-antitoxin module